MQAPFPSKGWFIHTYQQLREEGRSIREAWKFLKERFIEEYQARSPTGDAGQAWKNYSGASFEVLAIREISRQLHAFPRNLPIVLKKWTELGDKPKEILIRQLLSEQLWLRGELVEPYLAESQVDLIAIELDRGEPQRVIATYSIKVSLRERFQQDLYWAEKFRSRGIRLCFITLDNDRVLHKALSEGTWRSKQAKMAAALYDRIYLFTDEALPLPKGPFRFIEEVSVDLEAWWRAS